MFCFVLLWLFFYVYACLSAKIRISEQKSAIISNKIATLAVGCWLLAVSLGWVIGLWGYWLGGSGATLIIFYQNHPQELSFDLSLSD